MTELLPHRRPVKTAAAPSPDPLRVVHVTLALDVGGLERNIVNQVREGHKLGQRVSVICLERPGTLAPVAEALGAEVVCLHKPPGLRPALVGQMRRALARLRPHVVHTHQIASLLYAGLAAGGAGGPLVVHTEHGKERYAGRWRTRWLGRLAGRYATRFYCLSEDMAAAVRAHRIVPPPKVRVILNGIETSSFQDPSGAVPLRRSLGIPEAAPVVGTIGRLTPVKDHPLLLRAFARVRERVKGAHLVLVGDGPLRADIQSLAADLGVAEVTRFVGYQPEPQRYHHLFSVFALTSVSEGIPQALLEASAAGIPAVAARVGGVPEVIDHGRTGLLFDRADEGSLVDGLVALLTDRGLADRLGAAARDRVESVFHIGRMAAEYHYQFLSLLRGRRNARIPARPA